MAKTHINNIRFGLEILNKEVGKYFEILESNFEKLKSQNKYKVFFRDNKLFQGGRSLELNGKTLVSQFIMPIMYSSTDSFLSIATYDIWFDEHNFSLDEKGMRKSFAVEEHQKGYIHYALYLDDNGKYVWANVKNEEIVYTTLELVDHWVNKLMELI